MRREKSDSVQMKIILKSAKILQENNPLHGQICDIHIEGGRIQYIGQVEDSHPDAVYVRSENLHVSLGWMDLGTHICEPGNEHRERLSETIRAARRGGYTSIFGVGDTIPSLQHGATIVQLVERARNLQFNLALLANISEDRKGADLTEMHDLAAHGVAAFSDGLRSIQHGGLLLKALQYASPFGGTIVHSAMDKQLSFEGFMHEGITSTMMGVRGIPSLAEYTKVRKDLDILNYSGGRLCMHGISTKESAAALVHSKAAFTVPYLNLVKSDQDLAGFDSHLKVLPPIRSTEDREALIQALKESEQSAIISNHVPREIEAKMLEFTYADFGAIGLETCFAALNSSYISGLDLELIVDKLSAGPRHVLGLSKPMIETGMDADLTVFDPSQSWKYDRSVSQSQNSPFIGTTFRGKVIGTYSNNHWFENI
jgi:dihydroorotase